MPPNIGRLLPWPLAMCLTTPGVSPRGEPSQA